MLAVHMLFDAPVRQAQWPSSCECCSCSIVCTCHGSSSAGAAAGGVSRAEALGAAGFVSKTYLSFYAVLLCEVLVAAPQVRMSIKCS